MPRLFYALWPDAATRAALAAAGGALDVRDGRRVRSDNLHLTLLFLGAVDDATAGALAARDFAGDLAPVELEIGAGGWFRGSRAAWLAPLEVPPALVALRAAVLDAAQDAGLAVERARWRPHVTVARAVRRAPRATGSITVRWRAVDFALVESVTEQAGARYAVLRRWPLNGGPRD